MSPLEPIQLQRLYTWLFGLGSALFIMFLTGSILLLAKRKPKPTQEELAERAAAKRARIEENRLRAAIRQEARWLMREIPHHLAIQQKFETFYREGSISGRQQYRGGRKRRRRVQFEAILLTKTEIWFRINGRKLPTGTSFFDIKDPTNHVLENLQYGIGRPVRFYEDNEFNFFIRIGLKNSLMGVPKMVHWADVVEKLPITNKNTFIVGINEYGRAIYQDFTKWPHGLILGATGGGKSIALKQILVTLLLRNTPQSLEIHLVDLKRTELPKFATAPHVKSFSNRVEQVQAVLQSLEAEMEKRLSLFEGVCNDLDGWNYQNPHKRLPRVMFVVDELARLTRSEFKGDAIQSLAEIASVGRSAGIHLLLATQTVTKEVLPIDILANVDGRICFSVRNVTASTLAVGNGAAVGLNPPGRLVFVDGLRDMYLQSPFISNEEIDQALQELTEPAEPEFTPEPLEFLAHIALENFGGQASALNLYNSWENQNSPWKIGKSRLENLLKDSEYEPGQENPVTVYYDGNSYLITKPRIGQISNPRVFMPVNGHFPSPEEVSCYVEKVVNPFRDQEG